MDRDILEKVGSNVREKRKQRGLSQEELGEKAGFHFSYIGGVERAEKNITLLNLVKIANALEIDVQELLNFPKQSELRAEQDKLLNMINQLLLPLPINDLKKVHLFLSEIMGSRGN